MDSGYVGSFGDVIHRGAEAIKRSNQSLEGSQEHREAQSSYIDTLMESVTAAGKLLFNLLLGGSINHRINGLAVNYFGQLTITQDALATQIRETDTISKDLEASNNEIGPMPLRPLNNPSQYSAGVLPIGVTAPTPVTTTRFTSKSVITQVLAS